MESTDKKVSHRSSEDIAWQELKDACRERDGGLCRCCMILTPEEMGIRRKLGLPEYLFTPCDVAHIESVGMHVEKTYDLDNVVYLCRACHDFLDSYKSPITGKPISKEEHEIWWSRILKKKLNQEPIKNNESSGSLESYLDIGPKKHFNPESWLDG